MPAIKRRKSSAMLFEHMIQQLPEALCLVDGRGRVLAANPAARQLWGEPCTSIQDALVLCGLRQALSGGETVSLPLPRAAEGGVVRILPYPALQPPAAILLAARAQGAQAGEEESGEPFRSLAQILSDAIFSLNEAGRVIFWNRGAELMLGWSQAEMLGQEPARVFPPGQLQAFDEQRRRIGLENPAEAALPVEWMASCRDGSMIPVEMSLAAWNTAGGLHVTAVLRDLSDRRAVEQSARKTGAQMRQILSSIQSILIGVDPNAHVTHWNTRAEQVFGVPAAQIIGQPFETCPIPWDWGALFQQVRLCQDERRQTRLDDFSYTRTDGKPGILGLVLTPLLPEGDEAPGCLIVGQDITARKTMERQMAQSQKLESIGRLAAGIAHEVNTPIQYVGYNIDFVHKHFSRLAQLLERYHGLVQSAGQGPLDRALLAELQSAEKDARLDYLLEQVPRALQQSMEGVERVKQIVSAMKDFSFPGGEGMISMDLPRAVESTVTVATNEWKHVAEVVMDFDPALPVIDCYPSEFNQSILNILVNAAHAISDRLAGQEGARGKIFISTRKDGDIAEIRIRDTGGGIPEHVRPRIFDPFFTTKGIGRGTGQGLYITHQVIVEKHHGEISFESREGDGTTFILRLPIHQEAGHAG